jgi:hypothetical protein
MTPHPPQPQYQVQLGFSYLVKMLYGLAFVPPHRVTDIFEGIIMGYVDSHKDYEGFIEYAEEMEDFIAYFQRTWTGLIAGRGGSQCSTFPPGISTRMSWRIARSPTTTAKEWFTIYHS